jgi:hypothetical protein
VPASADGGPEVPELRFAVRGAEAAHYVAVPTLEFAVAIEALGAAPVRSILLAAQVQIAARERGYDDGEQGRLLELFSEPGRWGTTLRTLPWIRTTLVVPPFTGRTVVPLPIVCSYDLEVSASRYFAALHDGEVPLEFLFSGSVFYAGTGGALQTARIPWHHEVRYGLPVDVWRQALDAHFPGSAWLRLGKDSFERLCAYKARHAFNSWDAAIASLLSASERAAS